MRIVKLKGGLGNQMFQYAYGKLIEKQTKDIVKLDYSSYQSLVDDKRREPRLRKFNRTLPPATDNECRKMLKLQHKGNSLKFSYKVGIFLEKTINKDYAFEPHRAYIDPSQLIQRHYYDGYWQSYRYIEEDKDVISKEFTPNYSLSSKTVATISRMEKENSVFIGIRKGDYAESNYDFRHFGIFTEQYYYECVNYIKNKIENPVFYIFTNDLKWCKETFNWSGSNVVYREAEDQTDDFEELMLMASCKHAIIVNSTFHWWGAFLIKNQNKMICCPEQWFYDGAPIDIIPPEWITFQKK